MLKINKLTELMLNELNENKDIIESIFVFDDKGSVLASSDMTESSKLLATSLISIWIDFVDLEGCMSNYNATLEGVDAKDPQYNELESSVFELKNGFSSFITLLDRTFMIGIVSYHKMSEKLP